jgi:hypothetical protein
MKTESASIKAKSCLILLALVLGGSGAAVSQRGSGRSTENLPSVIAKAVETIPFPFVYDGQPSCELLPRWEKTPSTQSLPSDREHRVVTYRDRRTSLEITDETTVYKSLQAVDWVVRLRNAGSADTPIIEKLRALDPMSEQLQSAGNTGEHDDSQQHETEARNSAQQSHGQTNGRVACGCHPRLFRAYRKGGASS